MGLSDLEEEASFKWIDGSNSTSENTPWNENEPNGGTNENCGEMGPVLGRVKFNDLSCSSLRQGICEKTLSL